MNTVVGLLFACSLIIGPFGYEVTLCIRAE